MSAERFCAKTPLRRTSSGRRGNATWMRLLTSITACCALEPISNVAVIVSWPFEAAVELKYDRFSTPESCSSIGAATVRASVSALAPGYVAVIVTVGGEISGYCEIGSTREATSPAMTKMMAMTDAKIGRAMKKRDITCFLQEPRTRPSPAPQPPAASHPAGARPVRRARAARRRSARRAAA